MTFTDYILAFQEKVNVAGWDILGPIINKMAILTGYLL